MSYARRGQSTQIVNSATFHNNLEKTRNAEGRARVLSNYTATNKRYEGQNKQEDRVDVRRRQLRYQQQNQELMTGYMIEQNAREEYQKKILREQDESMASAIFDMKSQQTSAELNARRICEEDQGLRELKEKLRQAKISKARAVQLSERDLIEQQKNAEERAMDQMMEQDRREAARRIQDEEMRKIQMNHESKHVILNQIKERETQKKVAYEEFLREKVMVDEIIKGIELEDYEKMQAAQQRKEDLQNNIRSFLEEREKWREEEKRRAQAEMDRIGQYNKLQNARHEEMMKHKKQLADQQDAVLRRLTDELEAKRKEEDEIRMLLDELYQEEAEQRAIKRVEADKANQERMKYEMIDANNYQKALKARLAEEQKAEEDEFRTQMYERFAADKRLEQMNEARRRREMMKYKEEVEKLMEERRASYRASVEAEHREMALKKEQDQYRSAVVERERQRLLREHANELKEYLPKGVLQTETDYEVVYGQKPRRAGEDYDIFGNPIPRPSRPSSGRRS